MLTNEEILQENIAMNGIGYTRITKRYKTVTIERRKRRSSRSQEDGFIYTEAVLECVKKEF